MSYPGRRQTDTNYSALQGANYDNQNSPPSRSPQAVQGVPRNSRSVSSTRITAPTQTQPINIYGVGQESWEYPPGDPRYVPPTHAQPYMPQNQHRNSSIDPGYHPLNDQQQYLPPSYPPHGAVPQQNQPRSPLSPESPGSYSLPYQGQTQPQFEEPGHTSRVPQQQPFSTYHSQPQNSIPGFQQTSALQYHGSRPQNPPSSSGYQRNLEPSPSGYPRQPEPSPSGYPRNTGPSPAGYPITRALPSENTTTTGVRHRGRDNSMSRDQRGPTGPTCRLPECNLSVTMDIITQELSEYCSKEHMQEDLRRGAPPCPACGRSPRRLNSNYCGSACERHAAELQLRGRAQPVIIPSESGPRPINSLGLAQAAGYHPTRPLAPPLNVRCPRCGHAYAAPSRSGNQPEIQESLPPCPRCGHYPLS